MTARTVAPALVVAAFAVGCAGCGASAANADHAAYTKSSTSGTASNSPSSKPRTFTINSTLTLKGEGNGNPDTPCSGNNGYDDITNGAQVVVYDNRNHALALGQLHVGHTSPNGLNCVFQVYVSGIPAGKSIYAIEVTHRGKVLFRQSEVEQLKLTLG